MQEGSGESYGGESARELLAPQKYPAPLSEKAEAESGETMVRRDVGTSGVNDPATVSQSPSGAQQSKPPRKIHSEIQENSEFDDRKIAALPSESRSDPITAATDFLRAVLLQRSNRLGNFAVEQEILKLDVNVQQILKLILDSTGRSTAKPVSLDVVDQIIQTFGSGIDHEEMN